MSVATTVPRVPEDEGGGGGFFVEFDPPCGPSSAASVTIGVDNVSTATRQISDVRRLSFRIGTLLVKSRDRASDTG